MASARQKGDKVVKKVMHEHKDDTLKSGSSKEVKSRSQAIAIDVESGQSDRKKAS